MCMKRNKKARPGWVWWLWCALPAVLAVALYLILPHTPWVAEWIFARGLFRVVAFPVEWLMSLIPLSVTEAVVVLGVPAIPVVLTVWILRMCRHREHLRRIFSRGVRTVALGLSLALLVFMVMDGANFSRYTVTQLMDLPEREYSLEELKAVCMDLAEKTSAAREAVAEDENGCMVLSEGLYASLRRADDGYRALQDTYPFLRSAVWQVKPVLLSHQWSYTGYTGVYCPWLGESSVNVDITPAEIGHTAAHEIAHTAGIAREDECNFLGWLACVHSGSPDYVYSGYLAALIYCNNALYKNSKDAYQDVIKTCSAGVIRDIRNQQKYWKQFEGPTQDASQQFNDTFIKVNGVEDGVISYNQMVRLMLRYYDQQGWLPTT